jgi:hypothetical protein
MANAFARTRENYPSAQEGVGNTVRVTGSFTTAGASSPTVRSAGPWTVTRTGAGQLLVTLTETFVEFLGGDAGIWGSTGNNNKAAILSTGLSVGSNSAPASFVIETQTVPGTAGDLTGPIVSFDIVYRKGSLKFR